MRASAGVGVAPGGSPFGPPCRSLAACLPVDWWGGYRHWVLGHLGSSLRSTPHYL